MFKLQQINFPGVHVNMDRRSIDFHEKAKFKINEYTVKEEEIPIFTWLCQGTAKKLPEIH